MTQDGCARMSDRADDALGLLLMAKLEAAVHAGD
jgi:hypothetical protein